MLSFEAKQVVTQIVAFLIMLWILKRYMWRPIMDLLDERRQKIEAAFKEAEEKNLQADHLKSEYEDKLDHIKDEAQILLQKAVNEGQSIAHTIQTDAQAKAHDIVHRAHEQAQREVEKGKAELKKEAVELSMKAFEKLVKVKLSDQDKERFGLELLEKG